MTTKQHTKGRLVWGSSAGTWGYGKFPAGVLPNIQANDQSRSNLENFRNGTFSIYMSSDVFFREYLKILVLDLFVKPQKSKYHFLCTSMSLPSANPSALGPHNDTS